MKNFKKLHTIAQIFTGTYLTPGYFVGENEGDVYYLQPKNFIGAQLNESSLFSEVRYTPAMQRHLLQRGDILIAAKGASNFSWVYTESVGKAIASTSFFVVRLNGEKILPQFLAWYLNHSIIQNYFKKFSKGTSMPSLTKDIVSDALVPTPSVKHQENICKFNKLAERENQLTRQLTDLRTKYYNQLLFNTIAEDYK